MSLNLPFGVKILNPHSDVNAWTSVVFESVEAANRSVPKSVRARGLTCRIKNGNAVDEYWWNGESGSGVEDSDLVKKLKIDDKTIKRDSGGSLYVNGIKTGDAIVSADSLQVRITDVSDLNVWDANTPNSSDYPGGWWYNPRDKKLYESYPDLSIEPPGYSWRLAEEMNHVFFFEGNSYLYATDVGMVLISKGSKPVAPAEEAKEYESVVLTEAQFAYNVTKNSKRNISISAVDTEKAVVNLPSSLDEQKSIIFTIPEGSKKISIGGTKYGEKTTVFVSYDNNSWTTTSTPTAELPKIPELTFDVLVKKAFKNPTMEKTNKVYSFKSTDLVGVGDTGDLFFVVDSEDKSNIGIYRIIGSMSERKIAEKKIQGIYLHTVRESSTGSVWVSVYGGGELSGLKFVRLEDFLTRTAQSLSKEEKEQVLENLGMKAEVEFLRRQIARSKKKEFVQSDDSNIFLHMDVDRNRVVCTSPKPTGTFGPAMWVPDYDVQTLMVFVNDTDIQKTIVIPNGGSSWNGLDKIINYTWVNLTDDTKIVVEPRKDVEIICVFEKLADLPNGQGNAEMRITAKTRTI